MFASHHSIIPSFHHSLPLSIVPESYSDYPLSFDISSSRALDSLPVYYFCGFISDYCFDLVRDKDLLVKWSANLFARALYQANTYELFNDLKQ